MTFYSKNLIIQDPWYEANINQARKHQIPVGSYHFLSKMPAVMQFENFRAVYDKEKQDLLPVVDAEVMEPRGSVRVRFNFF